MVTRKCSLGRRYRRRPLRTFVSTGAVCRHGAVRGHAALGNLVGKAEHDALIAGSYLRVIGNVLGTDCEVNENPACLVLRFSV